MGNEKDLQPVLDIRQNQLNLELGISDTIDNKAFALLATDVAILLFMAQAKLDINWWGLVFSVMPYIISIALVIVTVWPRTYRGAGIDLKSHPEYLDMRRSGLILQLIADTEAAISINTALNKNRMGYFVFGVILSGLATITLFAILIV